MNTELVQHAIEYFDLDVVRADRVEQSYSSVVRILTLAGGECLVLKIPFVGRKLFRELKALQILRDDLPVPRVAGHWTGAGDHPGALLLTLLPGRVIDGPISPGLAFDLGRLLARLHTHRLDRFGDRFEPAGASPAEWWSILDRRFRKWLPYCEEVMPPALFQRTLDGYAALHASLPDPDGPCLVHGDYRPGNVLIQEGRITGLLDFESTRGGDAVWDFVKIESRVWDRWPGTRPGFLEGYVSVRSLPDIERTLPFYRLYSAFGGVGWCVRRSAVDTPFLGENMDMLTQVLAGL